jgi:molybdopterin converting factor small subunit
MRVRVLLFGQLKDIVGRPEESLDLLPGTSLSALVARYAEQFPKFKPMAGSIACSVNREYAPVSMVLHDGDEVGLLPPVSGGLGRIGESGHSFGCASSPRGQANASGHLKKQPDLKDGEWSRNAENAKRRRG